MANTGIRQLTTNVGGVIKRIWYSLNGTTLTAELMSIDDTGKFKCVSEQITGLAGTGTRMVVADSNGNIEPLNPRLPDGADLNTLFLTVSTGGWNLQNAPSSEYIFIENIAVAAGIIKQKAYSSGVYSGVAYTRWERECVRGVWSAWRNGLCDATLVGTGNRAVYSDASGVLTNTSSDLRVKKNIENITNEMNVLDVLKNIRGVTYNWDNTIEGYEGAGEQQEIGVIAQEIEQYIPQVVGENATGYKSVDYAKLVAFLIETNKALLEKVEILESKVV